MDSAVGAEIGAMKKGLLRGPEIETRGEMSEAAKDYLTVMGTVIVLA